MMRPLHILFLGCVCLAAGGCVGHEKDDPIWEGLKIGDLAPANRANKAGSQLLKTASFTILFFEAPLDKSSALDVVWPGLYTEPIRFNDFSSFKANQFSAGFGQGQMWDKVAKLLYAAGAARAEKISLILPEGQVNDVRLARLLRQQKVFYGSSDASVKGAVAGPGQLALRVKAEQVPGLRGLCSFAVQPVFISPLAGSIPQSSRHAKAAEFEFSSVRFNLKMAPGDFLLLGPAEHTGQGVGLADYFFTRETPSRRPFLVRSSDDSDAWRLYSGPVVRICLFICTTINY